MTTDEAPCRIEIQIILASAGCYSRSARLFSRAAFDLFAPMLFPIRPPSATTTAATQPQIAIAPPKTAKPIAGMKKNREKPANAPPVVYRLVGVLSVTSAAILPVFFAVSAKVRFIESCFRRRQFDVRKNRGMSEGSRQANRMGFEGGYFKPPSAFGARTAEVLPDRWTDLGEN